jgi:hypothetical protein
MTPSDDLSSIDGLLTTLYDVISGPAGVEPDWRRERALFAPGARLIPIRVGADGELRTQVLDIDGYIESRRAYLRDNAFFERQVSREIKRFGHIAQVFSEYESSTRRGGPPFVSGVNLLQLLFRDGRWWIQSIMWENGSAGSDPTRMADLLGQLENSALQGGT